MKKLFYLGLFCCLTMTTVFAQGYQHDFQKLISAPKGSAQNYTFCETQTGYALAMFQEPTGGSNKQNSVLLYKTDTDYNVIWSHTAVFNANASTGFQFSPNDIVETSDGGLAICGRIVDDGVNSRTGGFLMRFSNHPFLGLSFDWMKVYPNSGTDAHIYGLNRIVEVNNGFMAIGEDRSFTGGFPEGIVMGMDANGDMQWAQHLYGNQIQNQQFSRLRDMVKINGQVCAVVGSTNGFNFADDMDVLVGVVRSDGRVLNEWVYQLTNNEYGDGLSSYHEGGSAIVFDEQKEELIVGGIVSKREKGGFCVTADYYNLLSIGIDLDGGQVKWSKRHEVNADLTIASRGLLCNDIVYTGKEYALVGGIKSMARGVNSWNGFILRLDNNKISNDMRTYSLDGDDYLYRGYARGSTIVTGGYAHYQNKNRGWIVESYPYITGACHQGDNYHETFEYKMELVNCEHVGREVGMHDVTPLTGPIPPREEVICASIANDKSREVSVSGETQIWETVETEVYPTLVPNGAVSIVNRGAFTSYEIYSVSGSSVGQSGRLEEGTNTIQVPELKGLYFLVLSSENHSEQKLFKVFFQ